MRSTHVRQHVNASRAAVYRAILDAHAVAKWMVPTGMTSTIHELEPREGGAIRISLTYDEPTNAGKTTAQTDTYHGVFVKLVPDTEVVQTIEFETTKPEMRGQMTVTITLADDPDGGTEIVAVHDALPPGVEQADNELGWQMSLAKLADLVEDA